ncbi:MAG TPA: hypothetical protein VHA33_25545 [Candidatus Angelobacter sp.]|jgi:hypothetical protein|nr:hypothetical protein [Candidatus Angelobacter sp.]
MGFLDSLLGKNKCPNCGTPGAQISGSQVKCLNPLCTYFMFAQGRSDAPTASSQPSSQGTFSQASQQRSPTPSRPVNIQYVNFQGQQKTFTADSATLRRSKEHILAQVAPKGQLIALARRRIQNLQEVEQALPAGHRGDSGEHYPNARERQVLSYHKKHKSTSPLYEKIRAKYPDW